MEHLVMRESRDLLRFRVKDWMSVTIMLFSGPPTEWRKSTAFHPPPHPRFSSHRMVSLTQVDACPCTLNCLQLRETAVSSLLCVVA